MGEFVHRNNLGEVCGQDSGFKIASGPDTVRAPDHAYLCNERARKAERRGYASAAELTFIGRTGARWWST